MFKSIFAKYLTTFMLIIIISVVLSTSVITTIVNMYDGNTKKRTLTNVTNEAAQFFVHDYENDESLTFEEYIDANRTRLSNVLEFVSVNLEDIVVFISDGNGLIRFVGGSEFSSEFNDESGLMPREEYALSEGIVKSIEKGEIIDRNDNLDGFFTEKHRVYILPIRTESEKTVGAVMTCTMNNDMDTLLEAMIKTIIMSSLWLMLASLIAVYFITEKMVSPLRAMSKAAKEFAAGHFDARVLVSGDDEVAELADAFNNMASSLQRSEETRRLFLANVSHDLRTPMTTISGFIDSILSGAIPQDQVPHYLEVISSEVKRLSRLVSSLLDITKIQAGERKFTMTTFDICEMAREIIISSEQRLCEKELDVEFDAERDNMYVTADRDAIHQVLYNLCDNGIKFSDQGGKYIVKIHDTPNNKVEVSVYNEGEGIAPEDIPLVFDRFYKSDRSRGLDKTGAGLGLYISRTIIDAHKENISVESEYGKWCRFSFTLPKKDVPKLKDDKREMIK